MGLIDFLSGAQPTSQMPSAAPPVPQDNGGTAFNYFLSQGLAPHQAAGIVGNLQGESGQGLNPNALNRGDGRDGSDSIGIGQWNGDRAVALKQYAASKGVPWNDLNTQLEFLHSELKGPESAAYGRLLAAKSPEEAGQAMLAFERPKDWNVAGSHPERAQYAARAYSMYGGANPSMARSVPGGPVAPTNAIPEQPAPQFAQQPQQQAQAAPMQFEPPPQAPPILTVPRKPINLTALRAAFSSPSFYQRG